jgi:hypothetical protein
LSSAAAGRAPAMLVTPRRIAAKSPNRRAVMLASISVSREAAGEGRIRLPCEGALGALIFSGKAKARCPLP